MIRLEDFDMMPSVCTERRSARVLAVSNENFACEPWTLSQSVSQLFSGPSPQNTRSRSSCTGTCACAGQILEPSAVGPNRPPPRLRFSHAKMPPTMDDAFGLRWAPGVPVRPPPCCRNCDALAARPPAAGTSLPVPPPNTTGPADCDDGWLYVPGASFCGDHGAERW